MPIDLASTPTLYDPIESCSRHPKPTTHFPPTEIFSLFHSSTSISLSSDWGFLYHHPGLPPSLVQSFRPSIAGNFPTRIAARGPTLHMPFCVDSSARLQSRSSDGRTSRMPISRLHKARYHARCHLMMQKVCFWAEGCPRECNCQAKHQDHQHHFLLLGVHSRETLCQILEVGSAIVIYTAHRMSWLSLDDVDIQARLRENALGKSTPFPN